MACETFRDDGAPAVRRGPSWYLRHPSRRTSIASRPSMMSQIGWPRLRPGSAVHSAQGGSRAGRGRQAAHLEEATPAIGGCRGKEACNLQESTLRLTDDEAGRPSRRIAHSSSVLRPNSSEPRCANRRCVDLLSAFVVGGRNVGLKKSAESSETVDASTGGGLSETCRPVLFQAN